ncbi:MAG: hypothetical protein JNL74_13165 [Fibrobacteres bacterium]|nr:hypothetical protein [Fibrobacterota bacterium]
MDIKTSLDKQGLRDIGKYLEKNSVRQSEPESLINYLKDFHISADPLVSPDSITIRPFSRWKIRPSKAGGPVTTKLLSFPTAILREDGNPDTANFYLFSREPLANNKAILWAPGFGVSDFAFRFIRRFFEEELSQGWTVLVWVPPYHLERKKEDADAGDGLITINPIDLMNNVYTSVRELSTGAAWLKSQGVTKIGAWGGSFGAANLLLLGQTVEFDHMSLMIPLVDWSTLWASPSLEQTKLLFTNKGYSDSLMKAALNAISPVGRFPITKAERIQFLYARYDQLTEETTILKYGRSLGSVEFHGFNESHGTILLNSGVYRAYADFLHHMDSSLLDSNHL